MQDHLNLIYREEEREMLPLCREEKIGVIPYSPLASGRLMNFLSRAAALPAAHHLENGEKVEHRAPTCPT